MGATHSGSQPESAKGQLRTTVRRRTTEGACVGEGQRAVMHSIEEGANEMGRTQTYRLSGVVWLLTTALVFVGMSQVSAQDNADGKGDAKAAASQAASTSKPSFEVYGFAMLDIGQNFKQIHPDWYDTLRVVKLPTFNDEFGHNNSTFAGVRQSRLGVRSSTPTDYGDLKTIFEFELFGTGVDAGQTTVGLG